MCHVITSLLVTHLAGTRDGGATNRDGVRSESVDDNLFREDPTGGGAESSSADPAGKGGLKIISV